VQSDASAAACLGLGFDEVMSNRTRWFAIVAGTAALVVALLCAFTWWAAIKLPWFLQEPWSLRKMRYARAAERSQPLIDAIKRYAQTNGTPPETLASLVPAYLRRVPKSGLLDYPDFIYTRFTNTHYSLLWWDLGSRHGKAMSGLWCYVEGNPEHAILALTVNQQRKVVEARVDRMPSDHGKTDFSPDRWKRKDSRIEMVRSLPQHTNLIGLGTNVVLEVLGPPDGGSVLRDAPWELRIKCPSWSGLDVFFYRPTGRYPTYIYGGDTEKIGDWAYVHE
jgi:hypothetical protein